MEDGFVHWEPGNVHAKLPNFFGVLGRGTARSGKNHSERKC
jgi:hypothetical protein